VLRRGNLSDSKLRGTDLSGANLSGANLSGADLSRANLSRAESLSHVSLNNANLALSLMHNTKLVGANLQSGTLRDHSGSAQIHIGPGRL
jgi:uncharacterized protein YjbI with pentapeptide repeats